MDNLGVIDTFLETFIRYIDSGFGLLSGDVAFLTSVLIGIGISQAGLFWALGRDDNILARLIRKVLYVGVFAFFLNNFQRLAEAIYGSFAGLGLTASGNGLEAADLLKPGRIAGVGYAAAHPLLQEASRLVGFPELFGNALILFVLLLAWLLVILAFFILSVQLFVTILEFKLTTLAGFVLVPFALWNRTAFLAERVLGNVIASGVKVMVLAVIVGIGSTLFSAFAAGQNGSEPDLAAAMSRVLGALAMLGLGIFGPGIASGLVSGAPQLGAGAALGTAGAAAGTTLLAGGAGLAGARAVTGGGLAAIRAGTTLGTGAATAYRLGASTSGAAGIAGVAAGMGGVARAAGGAMVQGVRSVTGGAADSHNQSIEAGRQAGTAPDWAKRLRSEQVARARRHATTQAIREADRPGAGANPSLTEKDD